MLIFPIQPILIAHQEIERTIYVAPLVNIPILGSQDRRTGLILGFQYAREEKRFSYDRHPVQMVFDFNVNFTYGGGWRSRPRDEAWNVEALILGRRDFPTRNNCKWYVELGWGLHFASRRTFDLDSTINSAPTGGFGYEFPLGSHQGVVGFRLTHISNAGTVGSNQGQNQAILILGVRF